MEVAYIPKNEVFEMQLAKSAGAVAVLMIVFMMAATTAATASAAEPTKILPEPSAKEPLTFTSVSSEHRWLTLGAKELKCKKISASGQFTSPNLGTYKELCEGATGDFGTTCTGVGDKSGTIALEGQLHYVLALLGSTLVDALVWLSTEFHFTCEVIGIKILVLVRGCSAALAEPIETLTKATKDVDRFSSASSGDPDISEILMEEAVKVTECISLLSINGGAFEAGALETSFTNKDFKKGGKAIEVLLMK